ncbi:MAG: PAS domain S-box protein, partial [Myxococcales bacterium]|nr:PAS domain S-box protein [Myxococcales bacterium]
MIVLALAPDHLGPELTARLEQLGHRLVTEAESPDVVLCPPREDTELLRQRFPEAWLVELLPRDGDPRLDLDDSWPLGSPELERRIRVASDRSLLRREAQLYREMVETSPAGVFRTEKNRLSFVNDEFWRMLEYEAADELLGQDVVTQYADPGDWQSLVELLKQGRRVKAFEITALTRRGRHRRLLLSANRVGDSVVGSLVDVTQVKRVEADLRASEELTERLLEAVPGGVVFVGLDGSVGMGNAEAQRILGLTYDELTQRYVSDFEPDTLREDGTPLPAEEYPVSQALLTGREQPPMVVGVRTPDGQLSWAVFKAVPVRDPETGDPTGALVTILDITARKKAEESVQRSENRYRELVERSPDPISIVVAGRIAFANQAALDLVRARAANDVIGRWVFDFFDPTRRAALKQRSLEILGGASLAPFEEHLVRLDGTDGWVELSATAVTFEGERALFVSSRDVTARRDAENRLRRYEAQMQHTQKLESLGILAGGIAHDFNNLLVAIVGNADLARLRLGAASPALECLDRIHAAAQRATDLTNQMLAYSGKSRFVVTEVDLSQLVAEMSELLGSVISKRARLHRDLAPALPPVEADPTQLGQVVMNLITNASDALDGQDGDVYVSTRLVDVDRGFLRQTYLDEGLPEGRYVCLEVRDTGCGMDENTRTKIFDPFFTTKATGRGLGLAATLGIVRGHRGAMRIDTEPGSGTLFRIYFPCSNAPSSRPHSYATSVPPRAMADAGILVIDDEAPLLEVLREQLTEMGFRVLTAQSQQQALELLARAESMIDLVLLDVSLSGEDPNQVLERLALTSQRVGVVLTSGYTEHEMRERVGGPLDQVVAYLQKPYTHAALKRV